MLSYVGARLRTLASLILLYRVSEKHFSLLELIVQSFRACSSGVLMHRKKCIVWSGSQGQRLDERMILQVQHVSELRIDVKLFSHFYR